MKMKKIENKRNIILATLIIAMMLTVSFLPVSATITPNLVTATLQPCQTKTVNKDVFVPAVAPKADVVFAFDLTGSMSGIIAAAKAQATTIMADPALAGLDIQWGVMSYMDYPRAYTSCGYSATYGVAPGDYAYSLDAPIGTSAAAQNAINLLVLGNGADGPQDYTRIFYESYADPAVSWRLGAKRVLVNFGDNVPHDCNLNQGISGTTWSTGADPGRNGNIDGGGDDLDLQTVLAAMALPANAVTLIECHSTAANKGHWDYWTGITGGACFITTSGTLVTDVVTGIIAGLTTPWVTGLTLKLLTLGFGAWFSVLPASQSGPTGTHYFFTEKIHVPLGTPPGVYTFYVEAVDAAGVSYGVEKNVIRVVVPDIEVEKWVWDEVDSCWNDSIRVPIGTELQFRILITNTGSVVLHNLHVEDEMSIQLEYRDDANYTETSVSPDLRTITWDFKSLGICDSIEITFLAEAVEECYGSNSVLVRTREKVHATDLVKVKVHNPGAPIMGVQKSIWDKKTNSWQDSGNVLLDDEVSFRLLITSTALSPLDVSIDDYLPDHLEYSNDATIIPDSYTTQNVKWEFDKVQPGETKEIIYHAQPIAEGIDDSVVNLVTSGSHEDHDSVLVNVVDPPEVELIYPTGYEVLSGIVKTEWNAMDAKDDTFEINLYYSSDNGKTWQPLAEFFENTFEYDWDTAMLADGEYCLQVVAEDTDGLFAHDISDPFIIDNYGEPNTPPNIPDRPSGETDAKQGSEIKYSTHTIDPEEDQIFYMWDWGDGEYTGWTGPYDSEETVEAAHIWNNKGSYEIKVKAKDTTGSESDWSEPLTISIIKSKNNNYPLLELIQRFLEQFPVLQQFLQLVFG